jgi:hypothetical protein
MMDYQCPNPAVSRFIMRTANGIRLASYLVCQKCKRKIVKGMEGQDGFKLAFVPYH